MADTLLTLIQYRCRKLGLGFPAAIMTSSDPGILQMLDICNDEVAAHCNREYNFPRLKVDTTFTFTTDPNHIAVNLDTAAAFGTGAYRSLIPRTLWNQTARRQVDGPLTDADWQAMINLAGTPSTDNYRITGPNLLIYPNHTSTQTYSCTYMSKFGVISSGSVLKEYFTADDDTFLMPTRIMRAGLEWRWRQLKGQPFSAELDLYEKMLEEEANREEDAGDLSMALGPDERMASPGLLIAAGSWPLP